MIIETITPYQENRALLAHKVEKDFQRLDEALKRAKQPAILDKYEVYDPDSTTTFKRDYLVTPRVMFGIWLIKRSLVQDLLEEVKK